MSGCALFGDGRVEPEVPLAAGPVLVVPFGEGIRGPFMSEHGYDVAAAVQAILARSPESGIRTIPWDALESAAVQDPATIDVAALGRQLKARYVITGRLAYFSTRRLGAVNVPQGEAGVELRVIDLEDGSVVREAEHEVIYPEDYLGSWGVGSIEESDDDIRQGLVAALARKITKPFVAEMDR